MGQIDIHPLAPLAGQEIELTQEPESWGRVLAAVCWGAAVICLISLMLAGALPVFHTVIAACGH